MAVHNARASVLGATTGTTWTNTTNAVDGAFGAATTTYAVYTNTTANAVGTIEVGWGTALGTAIPADATNISVSLSVRHLNSNNTNIASIVMQAYDGATAVGTAKTCTKATTVHADTHTITPTLAQIRSSTFKVRLTATRYNGTSAGTYSLDSVDIAVTYTVITPPLLNHVAILAPRNGTTTHTVGPSSGTAVGGTLFTPTAGNLLVCLASGAVTSSTPAGWTLPSGGTASGYSALHLWHRAAAGGGDSLTTTHNGSNYLVVFHFLEFASGTTFGAVAAASILPGVAGAGLSGLTGTTWVASAVGQMNVDATIWNMTWNVGTELAETTQAMAVTEGITYSITHQPDNTAATWSATASGGNSGGAQEQLDWWVKASAGGQSLTYPWTDVLGLSDAQVTAVGVARSDTASLSDTRAAAVGVARSDTAALTDSVVPTLIPPEGQALTLDRQDSLGLTDTVGAGKTGTYTATDLIGPSDSRTTALTAVRPLSDILGLTDSVSTVPPPAPASPLASWHAALANHRTAAAKMWVFGDSISEGQGASVRANRWTSLLRERLRTDWSSPQGGENYIPAFYGVYAPESPWTESATSGTGTPTQSNGYGSLGNRTYLLDASDSLTYTVSGTDVDIWWLGGGGVLTYRVDGGSVQTVNTASPAGNNRTSVSLGASGAHSVVIGASSGTVGFNGFTVFSGNKNTGIQFYDSSRTGSMVGDVLFDGGAVFGAMQAVAPQLVILLLGGNDVLQGQSLVTMQTNLQTIVNQTLAITPTPSLLMLNYYTPNPAIVPTATWNDLRARILAVAQTDPAHIALLDLNTFMPVTDYSGSTYYSTDGTHLNDAGNARVVDYVHDVVGVPMFSATDSLGLTDAVTSVKGAAGGRPQVFVGGSFQKKPGKVWNGSAWVEKPWKRWTGSEWKTLSP